VFLAIVSCAVPGRCRAEEPQFTTVCAVFRDPAAFAGKIVRLRATVQTGFEISFIVEPENSCKGGLWFEYAPEKNDAGYGFDEGDKALQKRQPVVLRKDDEFKEFEAALITQRYPSREGSLCEACVIHTVTAVMTGRVDYAGEQGRSFGHLGMGKVRFVMESVSSTSPQADIYKKLPGAVGRSK
jgi:hypothetical protein